MKHIKKLYLLLIFVLVVSICGTFPSEVFAAKVLKGTLSGMVLDQNGKPISNTQVYVYQRDWTLTDGLGQPDWKTLVATAVTTKNGQYKVGLPAGEYRVLFVPANLDAYAMEAYPNAPIVRLGDSIHITYGKTTGNISVTLDPSGKIGGYLFDAKQRNEGVPLANTPLSLAIQEFSYINCIQFVSTNAQGYYEFKGLKPYPWLMWVNCPIMALPGQTESTPVPNYREDYKDLFVYAFGQYQWKPLAGGTDLVNEILLEDKDFVNITGRLVYFDQLDQIMKPAMGITVTAKYADNPMEISDWGSEYYEAVTDSEGIFQIKGLSQYYGIFVLETKGYNGEIQMFYDEFYDNSQEDWSAIQMEIYMGSPVNIGDWQLNPIE